MEPLEFGKFLVQLLQTFSARLSPLKECRKGEGLVKKRLGSLCANHRFRQGKMKKDSLKLSSPF